MRTFVLSLGCFVAVAIGAPSASAQVIYDWPSEAAPAVVHDGGSLFFLGKDKSVWRVYKWNASSGTNQDAAFFTDINGDSKPDIVGSGKPSFALDHDSNPIWFDTGCDQLLVGDFALDAKKDFVCLKGRTLEARTWDWQKIWSISIGKSWEWCVAGDINGDLKDDVECKVRGSKRFSRVDGVSGEMLAADADTAEITDPKSPNIAAADTSILDGKQSFDLDMDGTSEETLVIDGNAVVIRSRSKKAALGRLEVGAVPTAALVKDLDGDKKPEVIVVSSKMIAIWSHGDKEAKTFPLSASRYKRKPVADLESVYANGFDDDAAAKKVVEDLNDKLASCYATQVAKNQFAGVGRTLLEVQVDAGGKVKNVQKHHAELADDKVVTCAQKVLRAGKYPKAAGDAASVNVTLTYTFRDE